MSKTLNIELSLQLVQDNGGTNVNVVQPPFSRAVTVADNSGYQEFTLPSGMAGWQSIMPVGAGEKTAIVILPAYGTTNTQDANYGRLKVRITTSSGTETFEALDAAYFSLPAATTALEVQNPDTNNATPIQVVSYKRG